jgi:hypothetical protein
MLLTLCALWPNFNIRQQTYRSALRWLVREEAVAAAAWKHIGALLRLSILRTARRKSIDAALHRCDVSPANRIEERGDKIESAQEPLGGFPWAGRFEMDDRSVAQRVPDSGLQLFTRLKKARDDLAEVLAQEKVLSKLGKRENARVLHFLRAQRREGRTLSARDISDFRRSTDERKQIERMRRSRTHAQARLVQVWAEVQKFVDGFRSPGNAGLFNLLDRLSPQLGLDSADRAISAVAKLLARPHAAASRPAVAKAEPVEQKHCEVVSDRLLDTSEGVIYSHAAKILGVTERHVRRLVRKNKLESVGGGQHKKITTESLHRRRGLTVKKSFGPKRT